MVVGNSPLILRHRKLRVNSVALGILVVSIVAVILFVTVHWQFTESAVIKSLQDASSSTVEMAHYRRTYFPHPGGIGEEVTFRRQSNPGIPLIRVHKLTIQGSYLGLVTKHVPRIQADGMTVFIPAQKTDQTFRSSGNVVIDEFVANGATLEVESKTPDTEPLRFVIHECTLHNVGTGAAVSFGIKLSNPTPPGEISATGALGPWKVTDPYQTPVSGNYSFQHADLGVFKGIAGTLSSTGKFQGALEHIAVQGITSTPDFQVTRSRHRVELDNSFNAFVNARNGDVALQQVESHFWKTSVISLGSVAGAPGQKGKTTDLNMQSRKSRIEDILKLFIREDQSPMTGDTSFRIRVTIPNGKGSFLKKVELQGDFGVYPGTFTKSKTQEDVNKLSAESRGEKDEDSETVLSDLKGHVELKDGVATFSNLSFAVPGALAQMYGRYDLISHRVDLHGTLKMDSSLSHMAHGPKALLLKIMDPFFKKNPSGSEVPVKITGTYEHPSFGLDLNGQKPNPAASRLNRLYRSATQ